jgi:hypothetical protein
MGESLLQDIVGDAPFFLDRKLDTCHGRDAHPDDSG